mgnify:CR=1 FL=1
MTYNFVTIFNSLYLPQAISLHDSLKKFKLKFKLWAICLDQESFETINKFGIESFKAINFSNFENKKLKSIRKDRSIAEYCWTITPISPKIIFNLKKNIELVTYVDADMYFLKNPKFLINNFIKSKKKILFTRHDFNDDQMFKEKNYGKFCVQFMTFKKNGSELIRKIWEKKCIEWCFAEPSRGRMGDQKYLDNIYLKFKGKIYISDDDCFRSTWNYERIKFNKIIAWHFHGLKIINNRLILMHHLDKLPNKIIDKIYLPYVRSINRSIKKIKFKKTQFVNNKKILSKFINYIKFKVLEYKILKRQKYQPF